VADIIWTTNSFLSEIIWRYTNTPIDIIPNGLPFGHDQFNSNKTKVTQRKVFLYTAGAHQQANVEILRNPIKAINKHQVFKQSGLFCLYGMNANKNIHTKAWKAMQEVFSPNNESGATYLRMPYAPIVSYMNTVGIADVGLAPLLDTEFNNCKSDLKILEYAAKKIPAIISGVNSQTTGNPPCIKAKNSKQWQEAIMLYMTNESERVKDGLALYTWARNNRDLILTNHLRKVSINTFFNKD